MKLLLELKNISKSFHGNHVLNLSELEIFYGEAHALLGENGAGKSTLVRIILGALQRDGGEIEIDGNLKQYRSTREAYADQIAAISQETNLIPQLTVLENAFLGQEITGNFGQINLELMLSKFIEACERMKMNLEPFRKVYNLTVAEKKMLEIIKALLRFSKLLIMDEPTDALSEKESNQVLSVIQELKYQNVSTLFITHKLDEVFKVCDRITVLRDGQKVRTSKTSESTFSEVVSLMVGETSQGGPKKKEIVNNNSPILKVKKLSKSNCVGPISFQLFPGEILGLTGLMGSGKTQLARLLFGLSRIDAGSVFIEDKKFYPKSPKEAINQGVFLVPEDRARQGLNLNFELFKNITLGEMNRFLQGCILNQSREIKATEDLSNRLQIKNANAFIKTSKLSGGNQQKATIAKWLHRSPKIMVLDEPTRGIDIKAREEVFDILRILANEGCAVLYISSDVKEIKLIADRILVMHQGIIIGEYDADVNEKVLMNSIFQN